MAKSEKKKKVPNAEVSDVLRRIANRSGLVIIGTDAAAGEQQLLKHIDSMRTPEPAISVDDITTRVRLKQVIALWEAIRGIIDSGRMGYADLQTAIEIVGIEIVNDVQQPFAFGAKDPAHSKGTCAHGSGTDTKA